MSSRNLGGQFCLRADDLAFPPIVLQLAISHREDKQLQVVQLVGGGDVSGRTMQLEEFIVRHESRDSAPGHIDGTQTCRDMPLI